MLRLGVSRSDIFSTIACNLLTLLTNKTATVSIKLPMLCSKNSSHPANAGCACFKIYNHVELIRKCAILKFSKKGFYGKP